MPGRTPQERLRQKHGGSTYNSAPGFASGFPLIEVLTVMAIMVLAMSTLIPAMKTGREHARRVQCLSNLKQWGMASAMYAGDWNTWLPWRNNWIKTAGAYLGIYPDEMYIEYILDYTVARCPADAGPWLTGGAPAWGRYYSYGINYSTSWSPHLRITQIQEPTRVLEFGCAVSYMLLPRGNAAGDGMHRDSGHQTSYGRHGGRQNVGFVDGHAGSFMYSTEIISQDETSAGPPFSYPVIFLDEYTWNRLYP